MRTLCGDKIQNPAKSRTPTHLLLYLNRALGTLSLPYAMHNEMGVPDFARTLAPICSSDLVQQYLASPIQPRHPATLCTKNAVDGNQTSE